MVNIKKIKEFKRCFIEEGKRLYLTVAYFASDLRIKLVISSSLNPRGKKKVTLYYFKADVRKGSYDAGDIVGILTRAYSKVS